MAEIKPIRAWRYSPEQLENLGELTSPLFDVVSEKHREKLYQNPSNSIHISVPNGQDPIKGVIQKIEEWKSAGVIERDELPAIYVYYQYFSLQGQTKTFCRKGFIANLKVYDWDEGVLLRHENTMPFSVQDRMNMLDATQMNVAPTHGLYTDPDKKIEDYLDESMEYPLYETEDYQGVRDVLSVIHDAQVIKDILAQIADKKIILADGHHRYESSLMYKKEQEKANPNHNGEEGYNYHMMYFTNTESDDLRILPTHRLVTGLPNFNRDTFLKKLEPFFTIKPIENASDLNQIILGKKWAFGLLIDGDAFKIRLKEDAVKDMDWNFPKAILELDLTIMHYFIIEKGMGILGKNQRASRNLSFERNFTECVNKSINKECQVAIITQDISIDTVKEVCYSGYTLPQKSTYFYPKVICGFLFSSIAQQEFSSVFDPEFK